MKSGQLFKVNGISESNSLSTNFESILSYCKKVFPYDSNNWDDVQWDITDLEKKTIATRAKRFRLTFALTSSRSGSRSENIDFDKDWSNLLKCLLVTRFMEKNIGVGPQSSLLIAFRYLYQVIQKDSVKFGRLENKHFVQACEIMKSREAESTCYKYGNSLELMSKLIDRFYLNKVKISFNSYFKRPDILDPLSERTIDRSSKLLLSEDALESIVKLNEVVSTPEERLIVETLKLLLFTGLRITELLSLDRNCLILKLENGEEFVGIRYYPLKGGADGTRIKWFGDLSGRLVKKTIYEIQKLTLEANEVARWLKNNPGRSFFRNLIKKEEVVIDDIKPILGTDSYSAVYTLLTRAGISVPCTIKDLDKPFRPPESNFIAFKDGKTGYTVELDKALFAVFQDSFSLHKHKKVFYPTILTEGRLMLMIAGKEDKSNPRPSIFDRYELTDQRGEKIHVTTHMFRRLLNTIYNEGGVPITILTKIFGRKNPKDTLSYLYTTPKVRTEKARELFAEGSMIGPKASLVNKTPIHQRETLINNIVESVHHLGFGFCCHDWATLPCDKHVQCLDNCVDFHMDTDDPKTEKYLIEQKERAEDSLALALAEVQDGTFGAATQADHYRRIADTAESYLKDLKKYEGK